MFVKKSLLMQMGLIWILTLVLSYLMGNMSATMQCIRTNLDLLEQDLQLLYEYEEPKQDVSTAPAEQLRPVASIVFDAPTLTSDQIAGEVGRMVKKYPNLDFWLLMGVIMVESDGDPGVVSHAGAIGLMQIMPSTGEDIARELGEKWTGPEMLYDAETNIRYGSYYLNQLFERFEGNQQAAIAAYNWGPNHISRRIAKGSTLPKVYPGKVLQASVDSRGIL